MSVDPEIPGQEPAPRWPVPPAGGWTADDLDRLPNLPPHTLNGNSTRWFRTDLK